MFDRRCIIVFALLLTLCLAPGLALAGQRGHSATAGQSTFELLMTWAERAWDSITGKAPQQGRHVSIKAGCGIDPNGCPGGGGAGGTTNGSTGTDGH